MTREGAGGTRRVGDVCRFWDPEPWLFLELGRSVSWFEEVGGREEGGGERRRAFRTVTLTLTKRRRVGGGEGIATRPCSRESFVTERGVEDSLQEVVNSSSGRCTKMMGGAPQVGVGTCLKRDQRRRRRPGAAKEQVTGFGSRLSNSSMTHAGQTGKSYAEPKPLWR